MKLDGQQMVMKINDIRDLELIKIIILEPIEDYINKKIKEKEKEENLIK